MAGWKMFDASPFRTQLGFQPSANPIGVYATLWMTYPREGFFPRAVIAPVNDGYPWNATVETRYVVGPVKPDGWDEESHGPRQRFY